MAIEKDVLDRLLAGRDPDEVFARGGLLDDLKKALSERILNAELDAHLDGERAEDLVSTKPSNRRNGPSPKTGLTGPSKGRLAIPRDRAGTSHAADRQAPAPLSGLRRRDRVDVRARHERARDPRPSRCIVHLIRHSLELMSCKDRRAVVPERRAIYRAQDAKAGLAALEAFEAGPWGQRYPAIAQSWRRHWDRVVPFFVFPEAVRRIVCTTNAIEALNSKLRRAVRARGHFPSDEAATKLLYLVLNRAAEDWKRPPREWFEAKTQFAIVFGDRFKAC